MLFRSKELLHVNEAGNKNRRGDEVDIFLVGIEEAHIHFEGFLRSEERRVGKECRSRWSPDN